MNRITMVCCAGLSCVALGVLARGDAGVRIVAPDSPEARATGGECTELGANSDTYCTITPNCAQGFLTNRCVTSSSCVTCPSVEVAQIIKGYGITSTTTDDCESGTQQICPLSAPCNCTGKVQVVPCGYHPETVQELGSCDGA